MNWKLTRSDLLFLVETLIPDSPDAEHSADTIEGDEILLEGMLDDERLFRRLMTDEEILARVSPWLFFAVLLRQARRDLQKELYTTERRSQQKVAIFDADQVADLLGSEPVRDYLAMMLASFTRTQSVTIPVRVRKGIWRRYRASDLDVESLMRYAEALDEEFRFEPFRRIADVCLFFAGMFPDYIEARHRYPLTQQVRPRTQGVLLASLEDYERYGQAFYRLAAKHPRAGTLGLDVILARLAEEFVLAEKPLGFLAQHYLGFTRQRLFEL